MKDAKWVPQVLSALGLLCGVAAAAAAGSPFRYSREGGEITIWSYEGNERVVRVPETIEGLPVTRLDAWTFLVWSGASVLELHLPATLATLGETPLIGMDALQSIFVSPDNPHFHSREGVLFNRDQTTLVKYPPGRAGPYVVPDGVSAIGDHAFAYAGGLGEVVIPDSVEHLGEGAFYSCQGLRAVTLPDRLSGEALQAFQDSGPLDEQAGLRWLVLNRSALLTGFPSPPIEPTGWGSRRPWRDGRCGSSGPSPAAAPGTSPVW